MKKLLLLLPVVLVLLSTSTVFASAIPLPNRFILTSGRVDVEYFAAADPVVLSASGTQRDVCAMIA